MARTLAGTDFFRTGSITHGIGTGTYSFSVLINAAALSVDSAIFSNGTSLLPILYCGSTGELKYYDGVTAGGLTGTLSTSTWYQVGIRKDSSNVITGYIDGASVGTRAGATGSFGDGQIFFGSSSTGGGDAWDGPIAELAFWKGDIGAAAMASLGKRFSPALIQVPSGCTRVCYYAFTGTATTEMDRWGGVGAVATGTPAAAAHPRVIYPSPAQIRRFGAGGAPPAGPVIPVFMHQYRSRWAS